LYTAASEAGIAIQAVVALARQKSLNVAQKYARKADQLKRGPSKNPLSKGGEEIEEAK
jgi:hypothetical protein